MTLFPETAPTEDVRRDDGLPAVTGSAPTSHGSPSETEANLVADVVPVSPRRTIELPDRFELPNFDTGELEEFDTSDPADMVRAQTRVVDEARRWTAWKKITDEALRQYADRTKQLRFVAGSTRVVVERADATELAGWDDQVLLELEPVLGTERYSDLTRPTVKHEPDSRALLQLVKNFPDDAAADIIKRAERRKPKSSRSVKLEKA